MLCDLLRFTPNIGDCSYDNYSVTGQTSAQQLTVMQGVDLTQYQYVTILVGANDVQGAISPDTFVANVTSMVALCIASGAIPIVGLFPVFSTNAVTGYGKTTTNYQLSPVYISKLKKYCIENNVKMADVRFNFGDNLQWYNDNIHGNESGDIAITRAFYNAIRSIEDAR